MFKLSSTYKPAGDQPQAIAALAKNLASGVAHQTLAGVTGSGKTFTMANVITQTRRPTLVISPNKTLAAQLWQEFREFFPDNPVQYFVSYYDYYQPEAYLPATDTYIEKDAKINDFIDRLRHATTQTALTRRDFVIVASVSCIYGVGNPEEYRTMSMELRAGERVKRGALLRRLAALQYERLQQSDAPRSGAYQVHGDAIQLITPDGETNIIIELFGDTIERLSVRSRSRPQTASAQTSDIRIFPAKHFVAPESTLAPAIARIEMELKERLFALKKTGKDFEAARLKERTQFDLAMLRETGYCNGIENYSRHLTSRAPGEPPFTLLDYLPDDTLVFIDESHLAVPQIGGMYHGDRARKQTLVEHGFRLPSALDNRPLTFAEFSKKAFDTIYVSATPGAYELRISGAHVAEQLIRPTGLLEPAIDIRPARGQMQDIAKELKHLIAKNEPAMLKRERDKPATPERKCSERALVVTLTKRLSEEICEYLNERGIPTQYLHSEIKTLERSRLLRDFRKGVFSVLVGINLLREGLDLPEVSLVAILDADKEGFLRNETTLIQTMGRAARHPDGRAILYADTQTGSIKNALEKINRRRRLQEEYNAAHHITPQAIVKAIQPIFLDAKEREEKERAAEEKLASAKPLTEKETQSIRKEMLDAAANLDFERAIHLRDQLNAAKNN